KQTEVLKNLYNDSMDHIEKATFSFPVLKIVVLSVLFGFAAGMVGGLIVNTYFISRKDMDLPQYFTVKEERTKEKKKEKTPNRQLIETLIPSVVSIYEKKVPGGSIESQFYLPQDLKGGGVILTNDGWIITSELLIEGGSKEYVVVTHEKKVYPVLKVILDSACQIAFLKIEAENLLAVNLGGNENLDFNEAVLAMSSGGTMVATNIENLSYQKAEKFSDLIISSEKFYKFILIKNNLPLFFQGSPLFDLKGSLQGIILSPSNEDEEVRLVMPLDYFKTSITSVLKYGTLKRPTLGVNYIDLAGPLTQAQGEVGQEGSMGALVYGMNKIPAVLPKSPAQKNGIKKGDIILEVEGVEVNHKNSLTEFVQEYRAGDKINLLILRDGEELQTLVELE
ncbi:MAG: hypothetical protein COX43_00620, partial [Parcubacteria group bacterium CG23_combo_of_CG06-09_8_20_14_all_35_9]